MNKIERRVGVLLFILILIIMPGFTQDAKDGFNRYFYKDGTFYKIYVTTVKEYFYFTDSSTFAEIEWDKLNDIVLASKQERIDLEKKELQEKEKQLATKANGSRKSDESTNSEQPKEVTKPKSDSNQTSKSNLKVEEKQQPNQQQTAEKEEKQQEPKEEIKQDKKKETKKEENASTNSFEQGVVRLTNIEREKHGLQPLNLDTKLAEVARKKSEDMAVNQYFSHNSPTYGSPFDMMNHFGITYNSAGENIAKGQQTPEEVVQAWMNSDGHRANILNSNFTHIGVGFEQGNRIWTQQFIGR